MKTNTRVIAFSLVSALAACGGGGGSGGGAGGGGGGGGGAAGTSYLFYAGSMHAVDPANPTAPITVEPADDIVQGPFGAETSARVFQGGSFDAATKRISNLHSRALMYAKTDGKFYRVDALKSGSLTPVQVSSEGLADQMCLQPPSFNTPSDYADSADSPYVYALPGSDGLCESVDDQWKMIRLGMSATTAPIAAKTPVSPLYAPTNGAVAAWLVHDGGALKKCDASFAACGAALTPASKAPLALLGLSLNKALLNVDDRLFVYDGNTDTLSPAIFTVPSGTVVRASAADTTHIYVAHERSIYRAPIDGSSAAVVIAAEANDTTFQMSVTQNKIVYMTGGIGLGIQLKALDKTGGVSSTLADAPSGNFGIFFVNSNTVYYSFTAQVTSGAGFAVVPLLAGMVDETGGGKSETASAAWAGAITSTTLDASKSGTLALPPQYMIRAEGWETTGAGTGFSGAALRSFDAATGSALAVVGTLPVADKLPGISCFGAEANVLCSATIELSPAPALPALPFQLDVFFVNAATAGSLTRVTNTAGENELPVIL